MSVINKKKSLILCSTWVVAMSFFAVESRAAPRQGQLNFQAIYGDRTVNCVRTLDHVGTHDNTVRVNDLRFYIHEISLLTKDGRAVPVKLAQGGVWQHDNIALIDLIDRNIPCSAISPSPNDAARYQRPRGTFTGVRFTVGLPFLENHSDPTAAPTPLNMTSMFWTWQYGYRFFTLDVTVTPKPDETARPHGFPVHLGSTGCESVSATEAPRKECSAPNLVTVTLPNFDPSQQTVKLDIRQILATSDVSTNQPKTAPGCMSDPDDQDCKGIFQAFGLPFGSETSPPAQSVFRGR